MVVVQTPSEANSTVETFTFYDLFVKYSMLTFEKVADSKNFYSTLTELLDRENFRQNLRLTSENLQFNCEDRLRKKMKKRTTSFYQARKTARYFL